MCSFPSILTLCLLAKPLRKASDRTFASFQKVLVLLFPVSPISCPSPLTFVYLCGLYTGPF